MSIYPNPAFRFRCFLASVSEGVWPGGFPSRVHRNQVRHGRRIGFERVATDAWQREGQLWPADEEQAAEWAARPRLFDFGPFDLPF